MDIASYRPPLTASTRPSNSFFVALQTAHLKSRHESVAKQGRLWLICLRPCWDFGNHTSGDGPKSSNWCSPAFSKSIVFHTPKEPLFGQTYYIYHISSLRLLYRYIPTYLKWQFHQKLFSPNDCVGQMTCIKGGSRLGDAKGRDERCFLLSLLVGSPACLW